jgi:hypothetical protein
MFAQSTVGTFFAHIALHFTVYFAMYMLQNTFLAAVISTNVTLGYNFVAMQHLLPPMQHLYLHKGSVYQ